MKIYIGADHHGFHMRESLIQHLRREGYDVHDDGDQQMRSDDDFPVFAARVVKDLLIDSDRQSRGILICGSGQGMCIAANRFKGMRAALGYDRASVRSSRNDDDANILCLPADVLKRDTAYELVKTFLTTDFAAAPRFIRRIHELDTLS